MLITTCVMGAEHVNFLFPPLFPSPPPLRKTVATFVFHIQTVFHQLGNSELSYITEKITASVAEASDALPTVI